MIFLGVNIDHIATIRQSRLADFPSIIEAGLVVQSSGADSVTVHLREDRRHIQDRDVINLKKILKIRLNLEMSLNNEIVKFAIQTKPSSVCIVPEKRKELTTEGGLNVLNVLTEQLQNIIKDLKQAQIEVSLFVDPDLNIIRKAKELGAQTIEIHTGYYANAKNKLEELKKIKTCIDHAIDLGLKVNLGHGLDYQNISQIANIAGIYEVNIGFSIIARAIFTGLPQAISEMKRQLI